MDTKTMRDAIIQRLNYDKEFRGITAAGIDGRNFSAADIVIPRRDDKHEVYRIAVIKYQ